jgi:hypothetical protein
MIEQTKDVEWIEIANALQQEDLFHTATRR